MALVNVQESYRIELPVFEGPFDLLLFFIERDELDIHDIPISKLTRDFLDYIQHLEELNMEIASEFILVAGTLMRIKSRMLIPRPVLDDAGEVVDPRQELVDRLLEYKRYKEVQDELRFMEDEASEQFKRQLAEKEEKLFLEETSPDEELTGLDLYAIMRTYKRLMERHATNMEKPQHVIRKYPYTTDQVKGRILERLEQKEKIDFLSFILDEPNKIFCVFSFLSVLELTQSGQLKLVIGKGYNNFWLCRPPVSKAG